MPPSVVVPELPALPNGRPLASPRSRRLAVAAYGLIACLAAVAYLSQRPTADFVLMPTRSDDLRAAIAVLDRGGPPLLGCSKPWGTPGLQASDCRAIGVTDDQGIYLYLSELGHWTGQSDPAALVRILFLGLFALLVAVYPLLFYELFGSLAVAAIAPVVVLVPHAVFKDSDIYWVPQWLLLLCLPGLALALRLWDSRRRAAVALLVVLMLVASFGTSIRIQSGLPILIAALGIVVLKRSRARFKLAAAAALVVAYLSIATFGFAGVRAYRDHVIGWPSFGTGVPTQHPFWHNAYIGLGYLPNRYGIVWNDVISQREVQKERPGTGYLSTEYERVLRHRYLQILRHDPGFVARNAELKLRSVIGDTARRFWLALVVLPLALAVGPLRRTLRLDAALAAPALALTILSPLLTLPDTKYLSGWYGTWGYLWLLAVAWLVVVGGRALQSLAAAVPGTRRQMIGRMLSSRSLPSIVGIGLAACAVVALLYVQKPSPPFNPDAYYVSSGTESQLVPAAQAFDGRALRRWRFAARLPAGWRASEGVTVRSGRGATSVTTTSDESGYQLESEPVDLAAGSYRLVVGGSVAHGGVELAAVDAAGEGALATARYWQSSGSFDRDRMVADFELREPAQVRFALSNWSLVVRPSSWLLRDAELLRRQ
jgi:hypothetical protein